MTADGNIQTFCFNSQCVGMFVPDPEYIKILYDKNDPSVFPFWAKLWPSAIALCEFIAENIHLVKDKKIFEVAAGLGMPSVFCARYASSIICSDYVEAPFSYIRQSIGYNEIDNIETKLFNWHDENLLEDTDVLLLSDINYEPGAFSSLYRLITSYIAQGVSVLMSTPQRLMAKPFIEQLLPFCVEKTTIPVKTTNEMVEIFIMRLEKQG